NRTGMFKVADFEGGKELTLSISHLDEEVEMFGRTVDLLNFDETGQQLQLNQTNSEWLISNFGDDPAQYEGKNVTLHMADYEYEKQKNLGSRPKRPGDAAPAKVKKPPFGNAPAPRPSTARSREPDPEHGVPF